MLPQDLAQTVIVRLKTIHGQVGALISLLENDGDPEKILTQFKAAQSGLDKAHYLLLDEVYRKALARKIVETINACPGHCGNEDKIELILRQFPTFTSDELARRMKEITHLAKEVEAYREKMK